MNPEETPIRRVIPTPVDPCIRHNLFGSNFPNQIKLSMPIMTVLPIAPRWIIREFRSVRTKTTTFIIWRVRTAIYVIYPYPVCRAHFVIISDDLNPVYIRSGIVTMRLVQKIKNNTYKIGGALGFIRSDNQTVVTER